MQNKNILFKPPTDPSVFCENLANFRKKNDDTRRDCHRFITPSIMKN